MVENFGLYLKHERELRGVPLEEIAESTKIHIRFLEALENGDFDLLPGEVFIKGYIRSYARMIGVDAADMINTYDESAGKDRREKTREVQVANQRIRSRKKKRTGYAVAGIALAGVFIFGYPDVTAKIKKSGEKNHGRELRAESSMQDESLLPSVPEKTGSAPAQERLPASSPPRTFPESLDSKLVKTEVIAASPPPRLSPPISLMEIKKESKASKKSSESKKKPDFQEKDVIIQYVAERSGSGSSISELSESDSKPLHLKIQVQGNSWFNVIVDGEGKEDFILPGGSIKNIYGNERFRLTIGNRRETHLYLNGKSIDLPPGSSDVIRDFNITANLIE